MTTKFHKFSGDFPKKWMSYFDAGTDWLLNLGLMEKELKEGSGAFLFYVYPHVLYFSLELFVKALAAHENPHFDAKKERLGHSATAIIKKYKNDIQVFSRIHQDQKLFDLIREYEKTLDTRFGETYIQMAKEDTELIVKTTMELRMEMCHRTGLK